MIMTLRSCALIALACGLAACGDEKSGSDATSSRNEVLKGTISDDMIAYDTLQSEPPAAKIVTSSTDAPTQGSGRASPSSGATQAASQQDGADESSGSSSRGDNAGAPASSND